MDSVITMVNQKSNIADVCALVDQKANYLDTEKMVQDLQFVLETNYLPVMKYEEFVTEQRYINESLCPLNCLGKWIWHGAFTDAVSSQRKVSAFEDEKLSGNAKVGNT